MSKLQISIKALLCTAVTLAAAGTPALGQVDAGAPAAIPVSLDQDGVLNGHVFSVLDNEKAPMVADVVLKANGKVVARAQSNVIGQFSFQDVQPGVYSMQGVSAGFTGRQSIVVGNTQGSNGAVVTSTPLRVAEINGTVGSYNGQGFGTSSFPASSGGFSSSTPSFGGGGGGGFGGGGGGGFGGGGFSAFRLGLIGAAVAVPVAIAVGDNDASPAE